MQVALVELGPAGIRRYWEDAVEAPLPALAWDQKRRPARRTRSGGSGGWPCCLGDPQAGGPAETLLEFCAQYSCRLQTLLVGHPWV